MLLGAEPARAALVSACSGVSLPPSVVTGIVAPVLIGSVQPLEAQVNILSGLVAPIQPPLSFDVTGLLATAAGGKNISLSVLKTDGTVLGPQDTCNTTTDSLQLNTAKGISIGGNQITGLGNPNQVASAGELGSIALGNNAVTDASSANSVAVGPGATVAPNSATAVAIGNNASVANGGGVAIGGAARAANTAGGAGFGVAIGQNSSAISTAASGSSPVAIGILANATGVGSQIAIGDQTIASGNNAISIGGHPFSPGTTATGDFSIAIGASSFATGTNSLALGGDAVKGATASATDTLAFGAESVASQTAATALGFRATATGTNATALGTTSAAGAAGAVAIGGNATAGANAAAADAIAIGGQSSVGASAASAIAIGQAAISSAAADVALGSGSTAGAPNVGVFTLNGGVAAATAPTSVVSIGAAGTERQLQNVAAGVVSATSTDAVNGSQLFTVGTATNNLGVGIASSLGGGAAVAANGTVTNPAYTVGGTTYNNVGSALGALQTGAPVQYATAAAPTTPNGLIPSQNVTLVGAAAGPVTLDNVAPGSTAAGSTQAINGGQLDTGLGSVAAKLGGGTVYSPATGTLTGGFTTGTGTYADVAGAIDASTAAGVVQRTPNPNQVAFTAPGGTGAAPGAAQNVTNVAPGALTAASTDAVNGGQLFATNSNVTNNTASIANLTNGTAGLVQQVGGAPGTGLITVGAATGGTAINVAGTGGTRTISGVSAGVAPTDAVNVSQLGAVGATANNSVQYNLDGTGARTNTVTLAGGAAGPVLITNVAPGALGAGSTDAVNGSQLFATNTAVAGNTTNIANNTTAITNLTNGTAGLVQQAGGSPGNGQLTIGAATGGTNINVAGTGGTRTISGVGAGVATTDAVNVGQLNAVGATANNSVQYNLDGTGNRTNTVTLAGGAAGPVTVTNVAPAALTATSTDAVNGGQLFATNTAVTGNTTAITNLSTAINNGTVGLVQQTGGSPGGGQITVGAATGGTSVSVAGTGGTRTIAGVSAGVATTDAVNVGQLNAVGATANNSVQYTLDGAGNRTNAVNLVGGGAGPVSIGNVAPAALTATSTDAVNGSQLFATNTNVAGNTANIATNIANIAGNTTAITNLTTGINNGTLGLVQQAGGSPGNGLLTVGAATGGTGVSIAGTGGNRVLSGLSAGLAASDAATVGQLAEVKGGAFNAVQYNVDAGGGRTNTVTLVGGAAGPVLVTNVAPGAVAAGSTDAVNGGQLAATNANVAGNTTAITANTTLINAVVAGQAGAFQSNNAAAAAAPVASGANASAAGFGSTATAAGSVAIGNGATSTGAGSVAIGQGSRDNGAAGVVSVGDIGAERRITNVAPGVNGTDAVNLNQLQASANGFQTSLNTLQNELNGVAFDIRRVQRRANGGTAGAMAVAGLPQAFEPGKGMIAGAIGGWSDQVAFAIGVSKIVGDSTVVKVGGSYNTQSTGGFNAGVGFQF